VESHESRSRRHLPWRSARDPIDTISLVWRGGCTDPVTPADRQLAGHKDERTSIGRAHNSLRSAKTTGGQSVGQPGTRGAGVTMKINEDAPGRLTRNLADGIAGRRCRRQRNVMNQGRPDTRTPQVRTQRAPPLPVLIAKSNRHCFRENGIISSHLSDFTQYAQSRCVRTYGG